jgi:2-oxoglutarate dehydrogenase E1 component
MSHPLEALSPLFGANAIFVEEIYARYQQDPASVDPSWQQFFASVGSDDAARTVPSWGVDRTRVIGAVDPEEVKKNKEQAAKKGGSAAAGANPEAVQKAALDSIQALQLIRAYRVRGHLYANLDPLGLTPKQTHADLELSTYGFSEADLDRPIFLGGTLGLQTGSLREIMTILRYSYSDAVGVEYMHIQDPAQRSWIQQRIESSRSRPHFSQDEKKSILSNLIEVEAFESFLHTKFPGTKRFSIQGGDAMIPGLEAMIATSAQAGVDEIVLGMPHRGRMNVLTSVMGKPYVELLSIFQGKMDHPEWVASSGDVKYHLGVSSDRTMPDGKKVHLSLTANPSHLEAVNPVVVGKVRAKQEQKNDTDRSRVMGVLLHGDAAFAGQGLVPETLALSELNGYRSGGTLHIIVNNQIGFTTAPKDSRSTPYPSDVAKAVQAPIFHINGDDPEAVVFACRMAAEFRATFKRDTVVDIICYRKYGHNEGDEPMFTQPIMYQTIAQHALPAQLYAQQLIREGAVDQAWVDAEFTRFKQKFEADMEAGKSFAPNEADWLGGKWSGIKRREDSQNLEGETGVTREKLVDVGMCLARVPEHIKVNPKIVRMLETRREMIETGSNIDWGMGEALAFGTLLKEGFPVRVSGQDCIRGTFTHRHSELVDQENESRYNVFRNFGPSQARFEVFNSNLSEFAVLGFEYGYSSAEPNALVCWEAQFGDFVNGAQVIIDQFIASAERKWLRMSGLTMLLPHGHEGQGPEHSSARLERFLQLCAEDNMQVANITTPANMFHALRRQLHRDFRKPLVIMTPKSLLRHKLATSTLAEFAEGTHFQRVIPEIDSIGKDASVRRVVLCSGKIYYDLLEERRKTEMNDIAIVRVEQIYPFPAQELETELKRYPNAEVIWCQEEARNNGAWSFVVPLIEEVLESINHKAARPRYIGRAAAASPAAGYLSLHNREQRAIIESTISTARATPAKVAV